MLRRSGIVLVALVVSILGCLVERSIIVPSAHADICPRVEQGWIKDLGGNGVGAGVDVCDAKTGDDSGSRPGGSGCLDKDGHEVECVKDGSVWTPDQQRWCMYDMQEHPLWHGVGEGRWLRCTKGDGYFTSRWGLLPYAGPDPETLLRSALDSVQLKQASFHIGAWPDNIKYPQYGIIWWVGAPLWLWIDNDPHVWGTHPLEASAGGTTITATVKSTSIVYSMGDGETVTCTDSGKVRRNSPYEPMANESSCQHKYMHTNTLKDPMSRYTITAEVIWTVTWKTNDGHTGKFTVNVPAANTEQVHVGELRIVRR